MSAAISATIWLALICLVAAEYGKRQGIDTRASRWPLTISIAGVMLCATHFLLAFAGPYQWSHAIAIRETARQTASVFGVAWGSGVYLNYLFLGIWIGDVWWWRRHPASFFSRPLITTVAFRSFYILIIANAAVVFARPLMRPLGVAVTAALLWAWRPRSPVNHSAAAAV